MDGEFLADSLVVYIKKDIINLFCTMSIMDEFGSLKHHRAQLSLVINFSILVLKL